MSLHCCCVHHERMKFQHAMHHSCNGYHVVMPHGHAPLSSGGKSAVNSRKLVSSGPKSSWGQLSSTDRIAWVAQALLMT